MKKIVKFLFISSVLTQFVQAQEPLKLKASADISARIVEPITIGLIKDSVVYYSANVQLSDSILIKNCHHIFVINCE